jgi:hypothetical protein
MENHFYKKIYIITLCNFWRRSYSWPNTQHIQKLATEELCFLRYCRSSVFTFVFFMQKLSGISSGQNNKSCRIIHHKSSKIVLAFFWFICDFLRNLQESAKSISLFKIRFAPGSLEVLDSLHMCPCFAERPSGRFFTSQSGPWAPAGSGPAKFRRTAGRGRPGAGGGGSTGH